MRPSQILKENAGALLSRKARSTKTVVTLYLAEAQGMDGESGKYMTVCEPHGGVVHHDTYNDARNFLSHPEEWCPVCQGEEEVA